jgi:hypothetical protein
MRFQVSPVSKTKKESTRDEHWRYLVSIDIFLSHAQASKCRLTFVSGTKGRYDTTGNHERTSDGYGSFPTPVIGNVRS